MAVKRDIYDDPAKYVWGKSPNPSSWAQTAEILKASQGKLRRTGGLAEKLANIEKLLGEKK